MSSAPTKIVQRIALNNPIICPTCWNRFAPETVLWIATHPSLIGDDKLGEYEHIRFLPTRFDISGNAIDSKGSTCNDLACPRCHMRIPRANIELKPMFLSIAGTPSCGKSYFLTSMTWQLRQNFATDFRVSVTDADPTCNRILNAYEEQQFFSTDQDTPVQLRKTEEQGDDYASSMIDGQVVQYVSPFLFSMRPMDSHPSSDNAAKVSRVLSMYDNAGESFAPGRDGVSNPVTRHLGQAMAIFFCYDLMQDPRVRNALKGKTTDRQVVEQSVTARQEIILYEVIERFRRLTGLGQSERTDKPLVVIVTKYDGWKGLLDNMILERPVVRRGDGLGAIDLVHVRNVSNRVKELLSRFSSELVTAAQSFSNNVWFIPVSATGRSPELDTASGITGVRPRDIQPIWCDIPLAVVISKFSAGLVPFVDKE
jgi:hypothetical protein